MKIECYLFEIKHNFSRFSTPGSRLASYLHSLLIFLKIVSIDKFGNIIQIAWKSVLKSFTDKTLKKDLMRCQSDHQQ